ncbi:MAG: hypothetical protein CBD74_00660 [Saprospirales bacterium TMED214]|nr:MAG: hypothetical protein CBD74_00660 [Saprospirales bacterium TMED214]
MRSAKSLIPSNCAKSARLVHRTIKVARTIADLEGCDEIGVNHLSEALQLRCAV